MRYPFFVLILVFIFSFESAAANPPNSPSPPSPTAAIRKVYLQLQSFHGGVINIGRKIRRSLSKDLGKGRRSSESSLNFTDLFNELDRSSNLCTLTANQNWKEDWADKVVNSALQRIGNGDFEHDPGSSFKESFIRKWMIIFEFLMNAEISGRSTEEFRDTVRELRAIRSNLETIIERGILPVPLFNDENGDSFFRASQFVKYWYAGFSPIGIQILPESEFTKLNSHVFSHPLVEGPFAFARHDLLHTLKVISLNYIDFLRKPGDSDQEAAAKCEEFDSCFKAISTSNKPIPYSPLALFFLLHEMLPIPNQAEAVSPLRAFFTNNANLTDAPHTNYDRSVFGNGNEGTLIELLIELELNQAQTSISSSLLAGTKEEKRNICAWVYTAALEMKDPFAFLRKHPPYLKTFNQLKGTILPEDLNIDARTLARILTALNFQCHSDFRFNTRIFRSNEVSVLDGEIHFKHNFENTWNTHFWESILNKVDATKNAGKGIVDTYQTSESCEALRQQFSRPTQLVIH